MPWFYSLDILMNEDTGMDSDIHCDHDLDDFHNY